MLKHLIPPTLILLNSSAVIAEIAEPIEPKEEVVERSKVAPYLGAGLSFGGDELLTIEYTDGSDQTLSAGNGLFIEGGIDAEVMPSVFLRGAIGYHFTSSNAKNGEAKFDRYTFEGTAYKTWGAHGIGAGISHHRSIELSCDFDKICDGSVEYQNATGPHIEYNYRSEVKGNSAFTWSIRYTSIEYSVSSSAPKINGNQIDISIGALFF